MPKAHAYSEDPDKHNKSPDSPVEMIRTNNLFNNPTARNDYRLKDAVTRLAISRSNKF